MMRRATIAMILLAAALAGGVTAWLLARPEPPPALAKATRFDVPRALASFELRDQAAGAFGLERLRGRWTLMFFGFTNCPDICPTTLAILAEVRRRLADLPAATQPQVVLVSVDPGRDTPQQLASYVAHFDPSFVGVTGEPSQIEALAREFGVAVILGVPGEDGSYSVDHSAAIFLIDPQGAESAVFTTPHAAATIADDYRLLVGADRG